MVFDEKGGSCIRGTPASVREFELPMEERFRHLRPIHIGTIVNLLLAGWAYYLGFTMRGRGGG